MVSSVSFRGRDSWKITYTLQRNLNRNNLHTAASDVFPYPYEVYHS